MTYIEVHIDGVIQVDNTQPPTVLLVKNMCQSTAQSYEVDSHGG